MNNKKVRFLLMKRSDILDSLKQFLFPFKDIKDHYSAKEVKKYCNIDKDGNVYYNTKLIFKSSRKYRWGWKLQFFVEDIK